MKKSDGEYFAKEKSFMFYETSAFLGTNINESFYVLAQKILQEINENKIDLSDQVKKEIDKIK